MTQQQARVLAAGELLRKLGRLADEPEPQTLAAMAAGDGCDLDFDATLPLIEQHGIWF